MILIDTIGHQSEIQIGPIEALDHAYRRGVLFALLSHNPRNLDELPARVLTRGKGDIEEGRKELIEIHLPMLAQAGFIDWDRESGVVTRGDRFKEVTAVLKSLGSEDDQ